jgi:hypothetical protein
MGQVLAWMCLVLVASTSGYGLQLAAAAILPSPLGSVQHPVTSASITRRVLIVVVNPRTGDRWHAECDAPPNSFASDTVLVDANAFLAVASACTRVFAPEVGP